MVAAQLVPVLGTLVLGMLPGCGADEGLALPNEAHTSLDESRFELVARFVQISDSQIVDEESPGRLASLARLHPSAWRPHERFSIHLLDGMIRAVNACHRLVARVDFLIHTGDALDNAQANELGWFLDCFDGGLIDPLSGIDDRPVEVRGPRLLDPHAPFEAEGLYRQGLHGDRPSIPWYVVVGNHDRYAVGIFPVVPRPLGGLGAPLPRVFEIDPFLPAALRPDSGIAFGAITPADPGPPVPGLPVLVPARRARTFLRAVDYIPAYFETLTGPRGHGFADAKTSWYSTSPVAGLRLIALDTSVPSLTLPSGIYDSGALVARQMDFLVAELDKAQAAGELVLIASHHPSFNLLPVLGSAVAPEEFRALLNSYPNVVAHLAGHTHRHRAWDRGGYVEFETASIIDVPQEARLIEIWRADEIVELRYGVLSHLYEGSVFDDVDAVEQLSDPLVPLRREAQKLAQEHAREDFLLAKQHRADSPLPQPHPPDPRPEAPSDRTGTFRLTLGVRATD